MDTWCLNFRYNSLMTNFTLITPNLLVWHRSHPWASNACWHLEAGCGRVNLLLAPSGLSGLPLQPSRRWDRNRRLVPNSRLLLGLQAKPARAEQLHPLRLPSLLYPNKRRSISRPLSLLLQRLAKETNCSGFLMELVIQERRR